VVPELISQMQVLAKNRAFIIAGNPIFNRTIKNGIFYINNTPLHQSNFATDKRYPQDTASVLEIVGNNYEIPVNSFSYSDKLPQQGIIIGDVTNLNDLKQWTKLQDDNTLLAGASGFFNEILAIKYGNDRQGTIKTLEMGDKALFILGSTFPKDNTFLNTMQECGHFISDMPSSIYENPNYTEDELNKWVEEIVLKIRKKERVIITIQHKETNEPRIQWRLKHITGLLVKKVMKKVSLDELLIEGGSTVSEILEKLNVVKLIPIQELETGVIRMKSDEYPNMIITTKPGSYTWPKQIWNVKQTPLNL
jgi:uncharacterized protein YgbK (DUF1537 family)